MILVDIGCFDVIDVVSCVCGFVVNISLIGLTVSIILKYMYSVFFNFHLVFFIIYVIFDRSYQKIHIFNTYL